MRLHPDAFDEGIHCGAETVILTPDELIRCVRSMTAEQKARLADALFPRRTLPFPLVCRDLDVHDREDAEAIARMENEGGGLRVKASETMHIEPFLTKLKEMMGRESHDGPAHTVTPVAVDSTFLRPGTKIRLKDSALRRCTRELLPAWCIVSNVGIVKTARADGMVWVDVKTTAGTFEIAFTRDEYTVTDVEATQLVSKDLLPTTGVPPDDRGGSACPGCATGHAGAQGPPGVRTGSRILLHEDVFLRLQDGTSSGHPFVISPEGTIESILPDGRIAAWFPCRGGRREICSVATEDCDVINDNPRETP
jgi:hypothetical protein